MLQPGRNISAANYRFGFNGKEHDSAVNGVGVDYDYGARIYNSRIGRFLSIDPITRNYPMLTPYQFASNSPIAGIDRDGLEFEPYWSTAVPEKILDYERKLYETDPEHADQIILMHNVNAFLLIGTALTAGLGIESVGLKPLLTNMIKSGVIGAGVNGFMAYAQGGDKYAIVKAATSGFFSGAVLGVGSGSSLSGILAAGGISGGVGEVVNQAFDDKFGDGKGYDLRKIMSGVGIGAVANFLSSTIVDKLTQAIESQLAKSISATETSSYRDIIKKAIKERTPRIGAQQLKRAVNRDIKNVQQLLKKEAEANKIALTQAIERNIDYLQNVTNNAVQPIDEKKK